MNVKLLVVASPSIMCREMSKAAEARLPCSDEVRRRVRAKKRGGESYDSVLRKMLDQYDPEKAAETSQHKN